MTKGTCCTGGFHAKALRLLKGLRANLSLGGGGVAPALSAASNLGIASENITHKVDANLLKHA